jgi:hypothetical protein
MNPREARRPGRPRTNPHPRREQLRRAKRAQRKRDRRAGLVLCQLKMRAATAARLRNALAVPAFEEQLDAYLAEAIVDARKYPNLQLLMWNRADRYLTGRDAFGLYERNWRFVDRKHLDPQEHDLIRRLAAKYGNGVLNV